ncbi:hypothetical protein Sme01_60070 [Sphaerisporangium melleum]|uniref:DUF11 domain-containing protein n=1 Tax=Sphaerisporangium melleum TaxID=321316 RepID=A0A917RBA1_9ACTN|nr:hypothetical protein [Sphaerisporangium melleum]GGK98896.1 hypothetical protein GCM10007964_46260 [Sphaerisporangium melleum]GII73531.1 hypothetical protein Sme01_60070 [Sphaerisporangium melleum]
MRRHLSALAALTLAGSLAGASLAGPATADSAAATAATASASATRVAAAPQSPLAMKVSWNKVVRRGGAITYTIKSTNKGEWPTDLAGIFGALPKGASKARVVGKASSSLCGIDRKELFCIFDTLKPNRSTTVTVRVWLKNSVKGAVASQFGTYSIDVPPGVDVTNEDELERLDLQNEIKWKSYRTKIVR